MKITSLSEAEELAYQMKAGGIEIPENALFGFLLNPEDFEKCLDKFKLYNVDFDPKSPTEFCLNTNVGIKFIIGKK